MLFKYVEDPVFPYMDNGTWGLRSCLSISEGCFSGMALCVRVGKLP